MATFPALKPSTRTFTPGRHPHSEISTLSGLQTRVRTSNAILEQRLRLTFTALTEAEMLSIRNHYTQQQGQFLSFNIPADLLSGTTTPSAFTPTGYSWLYANRPQIADIGLQRYDVSIELVTTPFDGANLNGAEFTVSVGLMTGAAASIVNVAGANLTVTTSIQGGVVADNSSAGFDLTVPTSLTPGQPNRVAPPFIANSGTASNVGGFTVSVPWPTHQTNDVALAVVETSGSDPNASIPSGWAAVPGSPITDVASSVGSKLHLWWQRATSNSMSNFIVSISSGDHCMASMSVWRDCVGTGNPWDVVTTGAKTTASTTATIPALTTTKVNTRVVLIAGRPDDSSSTTHFGTPVNANLTSLTRHYESGATTGNGGGFVVASGVMAASADTGTSTMTKTVSTTDTYFAIALRSY